MANSKAPVGTTARDALAALRLLTTKGIGSRTVAHIIDTAGREPGGLEALLARPPEALAEQYRLSVDVARRLGGENSLADRLWQEMSEQGVRLLLRGDGAYPAHLAALLGPDAPPILFVRGNLDLFARRAVGFAGSRKASEKGLGVAAECAAALAARGVNVISGYAHGVDVACHRAALEAGGVTTIVLAEGILGFRLKRDIRDLATEDNVLVVSEFSPRLPWAGHQAMARNRTICGLSDAMVLIESGLTGGTFEAGKAALELHRPLFVVDYAAPAESAEGNRFFLDRGARPLRRRREGPANIDELLSAVEIQHVRRAEVPPARQIELPETTPVPGAPPTELKPGEASVSMKSGEDRRLIEDFLPIQAISAEARVENSVTQARGYLSKALLSILHRWWARRPLVACRAAVYAALVPADQFRPANGPEDKRDSLARANAAKFLERLCRRTVTRKDLEAAAEHIRAAHGGRAPRVLDMFAGGGSIPLEAARLGCESHALELNPVAHLVELATLVYPARYGKRLVEEVRRWSRIVFECTRAEVGDLYPPVADPKTPPRELGGARQTRLKGMEDPQEALPVPAGRLTPVAYLWTRTVPCRNCGATVPLHRQTWLRQKPGGFVAVRPVAVSGERRARYELLESAAKEAAQAVAEWGFDPTDLSKGGETECLFCRAAVPTEHVKDCGRSRRMDVQLMAVVASRNGEHGKAYLSASQATGVDGGEVKRRLDDVMRRERLSTDEAALPPAGALGFRVQPYGFKTWDQLFTDRQLLTLFTFIKHVRKAYEEMIQGGVDPGLAKAVATYLALIVDKVAERNSSVTHWDASAEFIQVDIGSGRMRMTWDFPEVNPFGGASGSWDQSTRDTLGALEALVADGLKSCVVQRGSALALPYEDGTFDAVVTDPPYYDNVPYSYLADFFYVWLKRSVGHLYPEHFAAATSPVKAEAVMDPSRHGGKKAKAKAEYEAMMARAFDEARRVLKPGAPMVCVYAHKTTAGWATLVDALRRSRFVVTEAWPLDTENPSRQRSQESAALASSIFLVARRRETEDTGSYEHVVRPELERVVRERVEALWELGIAGADLVIAAVGAGLRAFTRFARVEYDNGEEVPAEKFLAEVEGVVLETLLEKIFGVPRSGVASVDGPSRFYVLWRHTYRAAELDAGEAIVFTYAQPVELDGPSGLSAGKRALVEKKKGKYRLRDFTERGDEEQLGVPGDEGKAAPLIDVLHRILWLVENEPRNLPRFLDEARPDRERLRLVAQALAGAGLKGGDEADGKAPLITTPAEQAAAAKLTSNWRTLIDQRQADGQGTLFDVRPT
jgi:putative DNA methylase